MADETHVWDESHVNEIIVTSTDNGGAEVWCEEGSAQCTIRLSAYGVRQLRLALQRIERQSQTG